MGKVLFGLSVSLDGFIADKHGDVSQVFAWMGRAMEQFHEVVGDTLSETGAVIMGHRTFDEIDSEQGWVMRDGESTGTGRREICGPAWGQLRPTSLAGRPARRVSYGRCLCAAGGGRAPLRSPGRKAYSPG